MPTASSAPSKTSRSTRPAATPARRPAAAPAAAPAPAKTAAVAKPAKADKPEKVVKVEKVVKAVKVDRVPKPEKVEKVEKIEKAPKKPKPVLVRDGFTMPEADFALIGALKSRAMAAGREAKKSELLRAGLQALAALDGAALVAALGRLEPVKIGRPKKGH